MYAFVMIAIQFASDKFDCIIFNFQDKIYVIEFIRGYLYDRVRCQQQR